MNIRILSFLAVAGLAACAAAPQDHVAAARLHLICSDGIPIEVSIDGDRADLLRSGRHYKMTRRPTSFSLKLVSHEATFIQDGGTAVFVSDDGAFSADCEVSSQ